MFEKVKKLFLLSLSVLLYVTTNQALARCTDNGISLQILGSGGPFGVEGRASSGYLFWIDGMSRIMVDAGGGTLTRFHEAEAAIEDLQLMALSHFHPDHSAELPALLWPRNGSLRVVGPSRSEGFPGLSGYLGGLFGNEGVFRVLNSRFEFQPITVDVSQSTPTTVYENDSITVTAIGVPHGNVPTLAFRIESGDDSFVISSDQNGSNPGFVEFARDADVLVAHFAGTETATGAMAQLHARPSVWGQIATDANVGHLVLSHLMSSVGLDSNLEYLRTTYQGPLTLGEDLLCISP